MPWDVAVEQILEMAGTQFDAGLAATFEQVLPALQQLHDDL